MPMRAFQASKAAYAKSVSHAGSHVADNLYLWMILAAAATVVAMLMLWLHVGGANLWGHLAAVGGMLLGILVMIKAQEGYVAPDLPDQD